MALAGAGDALGGLCVGYIPRSHVPLRSQVLAEDINHAIVLDCAVMAKDEPADGGLLWVVQRRLPLTQHVLEIAVPSGSLATHALSKFLSVLCPSLAQPHALMSMAAKLKRALLEQGYSEAEADRIVAEWQKHQPVRKRKPASAEEELSSLRVEEPDAAEAEQADQEEAFAEEEQRVKAAEQKADEEERQMRANRKAGLRGVGPGAEAVGLIPPGCIMTRGAPKSPLSSPFWQGRLPPGQTFQGKMSTSASFMTAGLVAPPTSRMSTASEDQARASVRAWLWQWHAQSQQNAESSDAPVAASSSAAPGPAAKRRKADA